MTDLELKELMEHMTLEEKVGQLVQLEGSWFGRGDSSGGSALALGIKGEDRGICGSVSGVLDPSEVHRIQDIYLAHSRLKVPLLFMAEVTSGVHVCYPAPVGLGSSWDTDVVRESYRRIGQEAAANGCMVVLPPEPGALMCGDAAQLEARLGGADAFLNARLVSAAVEGLQDGFDEGKGVASSVTLLSPSRDGQGDLGDMGKRAVLEQCLAVSHAAVAAGCKAVVASQDVVDGVPALGDPWLVTNVVRTDWGYDGLVMSTRTALPQLAQLGVALDAGDAAHQAFAAGVDVDRRSACYVRNLAMLVRSGAIEERLLDEACWRMLRLKNELGLFEDPYRGCSLEGAFLLDESPERRSLVRDAADRSLVLLKNRDGLLPLSMGPDAPKITLAGPFADSNELVGEHAPLADLLSIQTMRDVLTQLLGDEGLTFAAGELAGGTTDAHDDVEPLIVETEDDAAYAEPLAARSEDDAADTVDVVAAQGDVDAVGEVEAGKETTEEGAMEATPKGSPEGDPVTEQASSDEVIILCLGEDRVCHEVGEAGLLTLPQSQLDLLRNAHERGTRTVVVLFNGQPLSLDEVLPYADAVVEAWWPGSEGAFAVADLLFGAVNPEGRLTMDLGIQEDFPFGFGLSYHTAELTDFELSHEVVTPGGPITAEVILTNTGKVAGTETVQLYLRDVVGSIVRPTKELKAFQKIRLKPGESRRVIFTISEEMLRFWRRDLSFGSEPGEFRAMIGLNSRDLLELPFWLQK